LKSEYALHRLSRLVRGQNVFVGPEGIWCLVPGPFDDEFGQRLEAALRAVAMTSKVFGTMRKTGRRMKPLKRETPDYRLNARLESWLTIPPSGKRLRRLANSKDPWLRTFAASPGGVLDTLVLDPLIRHLFDSGCSSAEAAWMLAACTSRGLPPRSFDPWSLAAGQLILQDRQEGQAAGVLLASPVVKRFGVHQKRRVAIPLQGKIPGLLNHFAGADDPWSAWLLHTLGFVGQALELVDAHGAGALTLADSAPVGGLSRPRRER